MANKEYWQHLHKVVVEEPLKMFREKFDEMVEESVKQAVEEDDDDDGVTVKDLIKWVWAARRLGKDFRHFVKSVQTSFNALRNLFKRHDLKEVIFDKDARDEFLDDLTVNLAAILDPILFYIKKTILDIFSFIFNDLFPMMTRLAKMITRTAWFGARWGGWVARKLWKGGKWTLYSFGKLSYLGVRTLFQGTAIAAGSKYVINAATKFYRGAVSLGARVLSTRAGQIVTRAVGAGVAGTRVVVSLGSRAAGLMASRVVPIANIVAGPLIDLAYGATVGEALYHNKYTLSGAALGAAIGVWGLGVGAVAGAAVGGAIGGVMDFANDVISGVEEAKKIVVGAFPAIIETLEDITSGDKTAMFEMFAGMMIRKRQMVGDAAYETELKFLGEVSPMIKAYLVYRNVLEKITSKVKQARFSWVDISNGENKKFTWKEPFSVAFQHIKELISSVIEQKSVEIGQLFLKYNVNPNRINDSFLNRWKELSIIHIDFESLLEHVKESIETATKAVERVLEKMKFFVNVKHKVRHLTEVTDRGYIHNIPARITEEAIDDDENVYHVWLNGRRVVADEVSKLLGYYQFHGYEEDDIPNPDVQNLDIFGGEAFKNNRASFNDILTRKVGLDQEKSKLLERLAGSLENYAGTVLAV